MGVINQFLLENTGFVAQRKLRQLPLKHFHLGLCEAVLNIDVGYTKHKDKLLSFLNGLKPWAQQELHRQNVIDLVGTIAIVERFIEFVSLKDLGRSNSLQETNHLSIPEGKRLLLNRSERVPKRGRVRKAKSQKLADASYAKGHTW